MERKPPYEPPPEPPRVDRGPPVEHVPPAGFVEYWDWSRIRDSADGVATGRLAPWLRSAAQNFDPMSKLRESALRRIRFPGTGRGVTESAALADLAVTGRESFARFLGLRPTDASLLAEVRPHVPAAREADVRSAVTATLDRAYRVAWALRGNPEHRRALRDELGWIAVSSEDDAPHAPTNRPCTDDYMGQLQIAIDGVGQVAVCRVAIKVARKPESGPLPAISARTLPVERTFHELITTLRAAHYDRLILFIHGLGSRLEESDEFKRKVIEQGREKGMRFAVLSVDLPGGAYSSRLDLDALVRRDPHAHHGFVLPHGHYSHFPLLTYYRDVLAKMGNHIAGGFQHVMGGSLGGNLSLWLAEAPMFESPRARHHTIFDVQSIASWSPGSIWESYERARDTPFEGNGTHMDILKNGAKKRSQERMCRLEDAEARRSFFEPMQRGEDFLGARTVGGWGYPPTKDGLLEQSEFYSAAYRRAFWMAAYEQVVFSHQEPLAPGEVWPARTIRGPLLLASGARDNGATGVADVRIMDIYTPTIQVSDAAPAINGRRLLMLNTGHSISDERPTHLAKEVVRFFVNPGLAPAATSWGPNRIDMFGLSDAGTVKQFAWNGGAWSWHDLGRDPDGQAFTGPLTSTSTAPERIDVFGLDAQDNVRRLAFNAGWHWSNLGRASDGKRFRGPLTACSWGPNRIDLFGLAKGGRNDVLQLWWDGTWHWSDLGIRGFHGPLTSTSWGPNRIDVFGLDEQGNVQQLWFDGHWNSTSLGRHRPPGMHNGNPYAGPITATSWGPNRIDIFGLDANAHVLQLWWDGARWNWGNLGNHFPSGRTFSGPLTATSWGPNRIDLFGQDHAGNILQLWWDGSWHWSELGPPR
jgi:hypothetical protein